MEPPDKIGPDEISISVIVVSFNTASRLRQCLSSVQKAVGSLSSQLIVVDNASKDGSPALIAAEYPDAKLIRNTSNAGFAKACNQGIREAKGRYVLLLNGDAKLSPNTLGTMVEFMDYHPGVGAAACTLRNEDGTTQASVRDYPSLRGEFFGALFLDRIFPSHSMIGGYRKRNVGMHKVTEVDQVSGAFLLVRRKVVGDVGLLDERFFIYYEDVDWCLRIKRAGWSIVYVPDCFVDHLGGGSANQFRPLSHVEGIRSKLAFFAKHHSSSAVRLVAVLAVIEAAMRFFVWVSELIVKLFRRTQGTSYGWKPSLVARICGVAWRHGFAASLTGTGGLPVPQQPEFEMTGGRAPASNLLEKGQLSAPAVPAEPATITQEPKTWRKPVTTAQLVSLLAVAAAAICFF